MNVRLAYFAGPGSTILNKFGPNPQNNVNGNAQDRQDNSVKYTYKNSGLVGMAMYSFGGVAGTRSANSSAGGLVGYDAGPLTLRVAGTQFNDANGVTLYAWTEGAAGTLGPLKVKATYSSNHVDNVTTYGDLKTDIWSAGATHLILPQLDVTLAYYGAKRSQRGIADQHADKIYLVPEYVITKQLWLYGIVDYEMHNKCGGALDTGTPLEGGVRSSLYFTVGVSYALTQVSPLSGDPEPRFPRLQRLRAASA
jgi:predicted porin